MLAADLLRAARARIFDPERWTQGALARDAMGNLIAETDSRAKCWCARGAYYAEDPLSSHGGEKFLNEAADEKGTFVERINDRGRHADVMDLYDRAIELAEQAQ